MSRTRRFMRLPPDWEELGEDDLARLCDRAERVQGILPELPPLERNAGRRASAIDDEAAGGRMEGKRRASGTDRETKLDLLDERGD